MDIALSDLLTCPRCGPTHGLILLPDEVRERQVVSGVLGCPNCRERYRVEGGMADLAAGEGLGLGEGPEAGAISAASLGGGSAAGFRGSHRIGAGAGEGAVSLHETGGVEDGAVRLAALLGLEQGGGVVLIAGPAAVLAGEVAEVAPGTTVAATSESEPGRSAVSRLRLGSALPLRTGSLRSVALTGAYARLVEEGARLVGPAGRLVLDPAPEDAGTRLEAAGLRVLVGEGGVVVAGRHR